MKKEIQIETTQSSWSLATNISFTTVPAWYGTTYRDLKCSVCFPKYRNDEKKYPLLIWLCGGAFFVMDRDVWMPQWIEFARQGCIVAGVEYRAGSENVVSQLCDVKAAIRYFKANADLYSIDRDRIFVAGESAGGTLACLAGVTTDQKYETGRDLDRDSRIQGVIDFYGGTDFSSVEEDDELAASLRDELNVLKLVTPDAPPFLIFQGDQDDLVLPEHSDKLYEKLCQAGVPADYYVLKNEGHGAEAFYQKEIMEIIREFIGRY